MPRMTPDGPRSGGAYRRLRAWVIATYSRCWICGRGVDKDLPGSEPWGPTLDHRVPLSRGGSRLDPANAALAHRRCNTARGDGSRVVKAVTPRGRTRQAGRARQGRQVPTVAAASPLTNRSESW